MNEDYEYDDENDPEREDEGCLDHDDASLEDVNPDEDLPFGTAGVSGLIDRLQSGVGEGGWPPAKCRMVAEYVLSLKNDYWLTQSEAGFCRRLLAAA